MRGHLKIDKGGVVVENCSILNGVVCERIKAPNNCILFILNTQIFVCYLFYLFIFGILNHAGASFSGLTSHATAPNDGNYSDILSILLHAHST